MSGLTIYRASAGSGKTFTLAREYLKLLFEAPQAYRKILAVTFTNKATEEMKTRILKELNLLTGWPDPDNPNGKKSSDHKPFIMETCGFSEKELEKEAREIMISLLHDYSRFSVSTIDSFFQVVIRAFTREIGLQGGFNIQLDQEEVLNQVVDQIISELDKPESESIRTWLTRFAETRIEEGKNWNFRNDIKNLGYEVFKEDFKSFDQELHEKLQDKSFLKNYQAELQKYKSHFENTLKEKGAEALSIMQSNGLSPEDFKGGKRSGALFFQRLANGDFKEPSATVLKMIDEPGNWYKKTDSSEKKATIEGAYYAGLNSSLKGIKDFYYENFFAYNSVNEVNRHLFTLGILTDISSAIRRYAQENNLFLLSDSSQLLRNIIDGSDTPYVYEKIGNTYEHYMIDEFQDTSNMQWDNFRPLVENSLDSTRLSKDSTTEEPVEEPLDNLVVGDVKQSIYRWRNSDWKLLAEQVEEDFKNKEIHKRVLEFNWRSDRHVVDFNNAIFALSSQVLQKHFNDGVPEPLKEQGAVATLTSRISDAYEALYQKHPKPNKPAQGYIRFEFLDREDWKEKALDRLPTVVEELQENGYQLRDIAILVRNKREGKEAAEVLLRHKMSENAREGFRYDVISNEALFVNKSPSVRFLVHLMRYLQHPEQNINRAFLIYEYLVALKGKADATQAGQYLGQSEEEPALPDFPPEFVDREEALKRLPIFEMCEELIRLFELGIQKEEALFIQAFQDLVYQFTVNHNSDLGSFLEWWEEKGSNQTISVSEDQDAIRILTVHKSKGLEFKIVLMPFGDWELDHPPIHTNILWCQPKQPPINDLELVPVRYSSKLANTIFYEEYFDEKLHAFVDNLNLGYVAFTRAEKVLIVFSPEPAKPEIKSFSSLVHYVFSNYENLPKNADPDAPLRDLAPFFNSEAGIFEMGSLTKQELPAPEEDSQNNARELISYISVDPGDRLKLRLHSTNYITLDDQGAAQVNYGTLMHHLFEHITLKEDVDPAIEELIRLGEISSEQGGELHNLVWSRLKNPLVNSWFEGDWEVLKETTILAPGRDMKRPDRILLNGKEAIVIDYKFGNQQSKGHSYQVRQYMTLIRQMGYTKVKGYVWYVTLDKVEEVTARQMTLF